jgi:hypothetical protein
MNLSNRDMRDSIGYSSQEVKFKINRNDCVSHQLKIAKVWEFT